MHSQKSVPQNDLLGTHRESKVDLTWDVLDGGRERDDRVDEPVPLALSGVPWTTAEMQRGFDWRQSMEFGEGGGGASAGKETVSIQRMNSEERKVEVKIGKKRVQ